MALLFLEAPDKNGIAIVSSIVYQTQYLDKETKARGVEVSNVPPLIGTEMTIMVLCYNVVSNEFVVEYIDRQNEPENIYTEQKWNVQ